MFTGRRWHGPLGRTAPVEPGTGTAPSGTGSAPTPPAPPAPAPAPPAAPAAFDPASLPPEARAYLDAQIRAADTRARTGTRDNAAKEARAALLKELTGGDANKTPEQIAEELRLAQTTAAEKDARINALLTERAIAQACRAPDVLGDGDLVAALLAHQGKLNGLDPSAADFDTKVQALVKATVAANPRLKIDPGPAVPAPGGSNPVAPIGPPARERKVYGSIAEARAAQDAAARA